LAAKPKNEFIKLWLNEFKSGLRLGIWAHHIRDSNKKLIDDHPHYLHKYRMKVLDGIVFMPLHWQDTVAFLNSESVPYEFPAESYGTHLWETILGDVMRRNEFLHKQKMDLTVYNSPKSAFCEVEAADPVACAPSLDDLTIYPEYYHDFRNDQFVDKYIKLTKVPNRMRKNKRELFSTIIKICDASAHAIRNFSSKMEIRLINDLLFFKFLNTFVFNLIIELLVNQLKVNILFT
jgi:hypothetical protein